MNLVQERGVIKGDFKSTNNTRLLERRVENRDRRTDGGFRVIIIPRFERVQYGKTSTSRVAPVGRALLGGTASADVPRCRRRRDTDLKRNMEGRTDERTDGIKSDHAVTDRPRTVLGMAANGFRAAHRGVGTVPNGQRVPV